MRTTKRACADLHRHLTETGRRNWRPVLRLRDVTSIADETYKAEGTGLEPATPLLGHHISSVAANHSLTLRISAKYIGTVNYF